MGQPYCTANMGNICMCGEGDELTKQMIAARFQAEKERISTAEVLGRRRMSEAPITVIVHTLEHEEVAIEIRRWETVGALKEKLAQKQEACVIGAPASWKTGLCIDGESMEDSFPLERYPGTQQNPVRLTQVTRKLSAGLPASPTSSCRATNLTECHDDLLGNAVIGVDNTTNTLPSNAHSSQNTALLDITTNFTELGTEGTMAQDSHVTTTSFAVFDEEQGAPTQADG